MKSRSNLCMGIAGLITLLVATGASGATLTVTDGLSLWLKADAGVTTSGGVVTAWADQSGLGHDATKLDGGATLTTGALNGLPAVAFSGSDNFSISGQVLANAAGQFSIFAVATDTGGTGGGHREIFSNWDQYNMGGSVYFGTTTSATGRMLRLTDELSTSTDVTSPSSFSILNSVRDTGDRLYVFQGTTVLNGNIVSSTRNLTTGYYLGTQGTLRTLTSDAENWKGQIAELLVYDKALNTQEWIAVNSYLTEKYFVPEPSTLVLLVSGLMGLLAYAWRKQK